MTRRIDDRLLLPIEGLLSGSLTYLIFPLVPSGLGRSAFFVMGLVFGGVIAAHFRVFRGVRSALRLIGFVVACAIAHLVSVFATFWTPFRPQFLNFSGTRSGAVDSSPFFTGGFLGAAIVCAAIFLFIAPSRNLKKFLLRVFCMSLACGLLGVFAWSLGQQLDGVSWLPHSGGNMAFLLLYVIWQTGAAALLGLLLLPRLTPGELPATVESGQGSPI